MTLPAYVLQLLTNATGSVSEPELLVSADGYKVDPVNGLVYGKRGFPIRRINGGGYVKHYRPEGGKMCHRIIWETVNQRSIPEGMEINHINGIKHDNRIVNLELVTPLENVRHAKATGLTKALRGSECPHAKLSADDVIAIRGSAAPTKELAIRFGVSVTHIRAIKSGIVWRHLLTATGSDRALSGEQAGSTHTPANEE